MKLSICIPTYNRKEYLSELLLSIEKNIPVELVGRVEICISDNASMDGTDVSVFEFIKKSNISVVYSRNETNIGADKNYLKVVTLASGEYCWFIGSDDVLEDGDLIKVNNAISDDDIYLFDRIMCDVNLNILKVQKWLKIEKKCKQFDFKKNHVVAFDEYFQSAKSLGAVFSYLSSIVFKRSAWNTISPSEIFIGTAYSHVEILMKILCNGGTLTYVNEPIIRCRGGNDSFAANGVVSRFMLDVNGYMLLATVLFKGNDLLRFKFLKILTREHKLKRLVKIRSLCEKSEWSEICIALNACGFSNVNLMIANLVGRSKIVMSLIYALKNIIK